MKNLLTPLKKSDSDPYYGILPCVTISYTQNEFKYLRIYIVIPSHNEANYLGQTLDSLVAQTQQANKVIVVNDNSTDSSADIISTYTQKYPFISTIDTLSSNKHQPGSKVINAFYKGFRLLDNNYDIVMKLDADIVLPKNYLSRIVAMFDANPKVGMASGLCFINKNNRSL